MEQKLQFPLGELKPLNTAVCKVLTDNKNQNGTSLLGLTVCVKSSTTRDGNYPVIGKLYPNRFHKEVLNQHFGNTRTVWNHLVTALNYYLSYRSFKAGNLKEEPREPSVDIWTEQVLEELREGSYYSEEKDKTFSINPTNIGTVYYLFSVLKARLTYLDLTPFSAYNSTLQHVTTAYKIYFRKTSSLPRVHKKGKSKDSFTISDGSCMLLGRPTGSYEEPYRVTPCKTSGALKGTLHTKYRQNLNAAHIYYAHIPLSQYMRRKLQEENKPTKIAPIRIKCSKNTNYSVHQPNCSLKSVTYKKTPDGTYSVTYVYDNQRAIRESGKGLLGLDFMCHKESVAMTVDHEGNSIPLTELYHDLPFPKDIYSLYSLVKRRQQRLSSIVERNGGKWTSRRCRRLRYLITKTQSKIARKIKDYYHKLTKRLVESYRFIAIENFNVQDLMKAKLPQGSKKQLNRLIQETAIGIFRSLLAYKVNDSSHGFLAMIHSYFPSSKLCNNCGAIYKDLKLSDRIWTCEDCNTTHNRDVNAAMNILDAGVAVVTPQ